MKKIILQLITSCLLYLVFSLPSQAQTLTYKPKNPAFGGNTFNYNWLLSSAQAQDTNKDPDAIDRSFNFNQNPLDDFSENLNRQLLGRLSQELFRNQFGSEGIGLQEGTYNLGDFQVEITPTADGLAITILDAATGGQTQVIVPFY
ncbi:MAG: curli assembly protein CsgF [Bacteroidetes bacterium]|nr:curli assembly protein CsgF [Bacteroidota bacterium]MDF1864115.1 curli assembly protein CsgF [Saprospiraceae bacterium]